MQAEAPPNQWNCFSETGPPDIVLRGWRALLGLPKAAQQNLWHLIDAALLDPDDASTRELIDAYAQRFEANAALLIAAVQACDFLLRQAASIALPLDAFRADLEALSDEDMAGVELLSSRYETVCTTLRNRMLDDALADHGNLVTGFDWRVDRVQMSSRGDLGDTPVVLLRLRYRNGDEEDTLSLQLTGAVVETLGEFCRQFSAGPDAESDTPNNQPPST